MYCRLFGVLFAIFLLAGISRATPLPGDIAWQTVPTAQRNIRFPVFLPKGADRQTPLPLVLLIHGETGKADRNILSKNGWSDTADRVGFYVAAVGPEWLSPALIPTLLKSLGESYSIDTHRIFAVKTVSVAPSQWSDLVPLFTARGIVTASFPVHSRDSFSFWQSLERMPLNNSAAATPKTTTRLTVRISGLRSDKGKVSLLLFPAATGFPDDAQKAAAQQEIRLDGPIATAAFPNLPPGDYAIVLLHDENSNGKMDTSFGFPLEGFGTSNNPRVRMGPPRFNDARFFLSGTGAERTIVIRMVYL
jgi:uncharacterized protein (DUF2141 family)